MKPLKVLSLFDGMSCGRIALERAGIPVEEYYASEIDKYAIQVSKANWPDIEHIGDVTKLESWFLPKIDLLIGGSPCQGFSFAGKQLNFNDPRSKLFFEFVRLLKQLRERNPKLKFFLENVVMKKEYRHVISEALGVQPILINSALVSAQNRKRLYWTNIPFCGQPDDRGILLKDILEDGANECLRWQNNNTGYVIDDRAPALRTGYIRGGWSQPKIITGGRIVGRPLQENGVRKDYAGIKCTQILEANKEGKTNCLSTVEKDNVVVLISQIASETRRDFDVSFLENGNIRPHKKDSRKSGISEIGTIVHPNNKCVAHISSHVPNVIQLNPSRESHSQQPYMQNRVYDVNGKGVSLTESKSDQYKISKDAGVSYRKLTPVECERLQGVPDGYTDPILTDFKNVFGNALEQVAIFKGKGLKEKISSSQRYKMLGNGWQVDTIVHLFQGLKYDWF